MPRKKTAATNGKPKRKDIRNSARPMRIYVSDDDIAKGKPLDPSGCAIAQAIMRSTGAKDVSVHRGVTKLLLGNRWVRFRTSSAARLETIVFDRGGQFFPGEYDLLPVPVSQIVRAAKSPSRGERPPGAKLRTRRLVIPGVRRAANQKED